MIVKTKTTCLRCMNEYSEHPAISRRDNKTEICSQCGTEEALIDAGFRSVDLKEKDFVNKIYDRR